MSASIQKSVLITGCSDGGIGSALAETFLERGYHVFATLRNLSKVSSRLSAEAAKPKGNNNVTILQLDVLSPDSMAAAVASVKAATGDRGLDILVNNSGQAQILPALDTDIDEARKLFDLNFWAPLAMVQAFTPLLIEARGCLVNNASVSAYVPMPFSGTYGASKAALVLASNTWQRELAPLGIRTMTLITCGVKTKAFDSVEAPQLPTSSYYHAIRDYLAQLTDGRLQNDAMDAHRYARDVVRAVERGALGEVWVGQNAFASRMAWLLLPWSIIVSLS
ncbi:short-chain dehydrogenase/reductase [Apiospora hydei]|uniref:Short-chain dehydrogenase/reductase n=1 Tax=Apiospora hydei TaxID=1337664 RepID=A0ABR1X9A0_9PEZI